MNNNGLTQSQFKFFQDYTIMANEEQVRAMIALLFKNVPTEGLHKVLELVDQEYERRGLKL